MLKWIDYIWFVGESFHVREKSPGDGTALLMGCWYLDAALPLLTFLHRVAGGCPGGAACPFRLLPFQIHGEAPG